MVFIALQALVGKVGIGWQAVVGKGWQRLLLFGNGWQRLAKLGHSRKPVDDKEFESDSRPQQRRIESAHHSSAQLSFGIKRSSTESPAYM